MDVFKLPATTIVNKVVPKNLFDSYTTVKQKKLFADLIQRITWTHKLAHDTVNLEAKEIKEIQVFKVELKSLDRVDSLLAIIDKAIPYNIIFIVAFQENMYLSTSVKHPHPVNADNAVVDWTFKTNWFPAEDNKYNLVLKKSLDAVYLDFCIQLSGRHELTKKSIYEFVEQCKSLEDQIKKITQLKAAIAGSKQFKLKVKLNIQLKELEKSITQLLSTN